MDKEIITVSNIPGYGVNASAYSATKSETTVTSVPINVIANDKTNGSVIKWGNNNDEPQKIYEKARENGSVSNSMRILQKAHYGNGLVLYSEITAQGKKAVNVYASTDEKVALISDFFRKNSIDRFIKEIIADLKWYNIAFVEYILSENFQTINRIKRHRAAWCRFEEPDEKTGVIQNVFVSQKFGRPGQVVDLNSPFTVKVPHIDATLSYDEVLELCKKNNIKKFIRPVYYPLVDESFYPKAAWHAVFVNGWLDVSNSVPEFKKNLFNNQMSAIYQVTVLEEYFSDHLYKAEWNKFTPEERKTIRDEFDTMVKDALTGNKAAGKMIRSLKIRTKDGNYEDAIEIKPIDNKVKDGIYLPEAEAANGEIYAAMGVDASMTTGGVPGGKLGAGSGSDKRQAFNILQILEKTDREISLEPLDFVKLYNNWPADVNIGFEDINLTTLDANPTGTKTTL